VVLKGLVDDAKKKAKAEEIAKSTAGVKDVKNQLTVKTYSSS
jgi:osmotically-inducible protein OsmY